MRKNVKRINMSLYMKYKEHENVYRFMEEERKCTGKNFNAILIDAVKLYMYYRSNGNSFIGMQIVSKYKPEELEMNDEPDLSDIGEIQFGKTEASMEIDESFLNSIFEDMQ